MNDVLSAKLVALLKSLVSKHRLRAPRDKKSPRAGVILVESLVKMVLPPTGTCAQATLLLMAVAHFPFAPCFANFEDFYKRCAHEQ